MADVVGETGWRGPATLDQLIALNDEIVALSRAGMPLERGLLAVGSDLPGRLRALTTAVGERMSRGESLPEALAGSGAGVPPVYRAVVEAGLKAGRLPVALEGLATFARGVAEARRSVGLALWYPLLVLTFAYVLLLLIVTTIIPRFIETFEGFRLPVHASLGLLAALGRTAWLWGPVLPAVLFVLLVGWVGSRRAVSLQGGRGLGFLRWFPWMGAMLQGYEAAGFAELLALLVENRVPYPEALVIAGEGSGDPAIARSCQRLAAAVRQGLPPSSVGRRGSPFPPLLLWLLSSAPQQGDLVAALRQMGARYREKARHQAEKIRLVLPTLLLFGIGATATMLYALALFVPLTSLWSSLARPTL